MQAAPDEHAVADTPDVQAAPDEHAVADTPMCRLLLMSMQ